MDAAARMMDRGWKTCPARTARRGSTELSAERERIVSDFMRSSVEAMRISVKDRREADAKKRGLEEAAIRLGYIKRKEFRKMRILTYVEHGVMYVQLQKVEVKKN